MSKQSVTKATPGGRRFRSGIDRMDHPLSHTSAIVGAVAFIFFFGCCQILYLDSKCVYSVGWWTIALLSASILVASVLGYFRPLSKIVFIPVGLAAVALLGLCVWHMFFVTEWYARHSPLEGAFKAVAAWTAWFGWVAAKISQFRRRTLETA